MNVPFQDLRRLHDSIDPEIQEAIARVTASSAFVGGPEVAAFESAFAAAHAVAGAVGCGSGTDALALTLRALGVGPGDEVVVPSMTFVATAEAVVHTGAVPVIADVDAESLHLTPATVAAVRTDRTKAVIPVHLFGHIVPFEQLRGWRNDGLLVIEDAAQAHLGHEAGAFVGSVGHAACFSFYPGKNLGAWGDGGAVISGEPDVVAQVAKLRDHGRISKYSHDEIGWCSRLDGLQAAILAVKLRHLADWTDRRRAIAERYRELLGDVLIPWTAGAVHHLLVMRVPGGETARTALQNALRVAGISSGIHYPIALSSQPSMARWPATCPVADEAASTILSLPMDPLMTTDEVDTVCAAVTSSLAVV